MQLLFLIKILYNMKIDFDFVKFFSFIDISQAFSLAFFSFRTIFLIFPFSSQFFSPSLQFVSLSVFRRPFPFHSLCKLDIVHV